MGRNKSQKTRHHKKEKRVSAYLQNASHMTQTASAPKAHPKSQGFKKRPTTLKN